MAGSLTHKHGNRSLSTKEITSAYLNKTKAQGTMLCYLAEIWLRGLSLLAPM